MLWNKHLQKYLCLHMACWEPLNRFPWVLMLVLLKFVSMFELLVGIKQHFWIPYVKTYIYISVHSFSSIYWSKNVLNTIVQKGGRQIIYPIHFTIVRFVRWHSEMEWMCTVVYPGIFFGGGEFNKLSWGQRELVWDSGGSCNLVQEISFHIVKFS